MIFSSKERKPTFLVVFRTCTLVLRSSVFACPIGSPKNRAASKKFVHPWFFIISKQRFCNIQISFYTICFRNYRSVSVSYRRVLINMFYFFWTTTFFILVKSLSKQIFSLYFFMVQQKLFTCCIVSYSIRWYPLLFNIRTFMFPFSAKLRFLALHFFILHSFLFPSYHNFRFDY